MAQCLEEFSCTFIQHFQCLCSNWKPHCPLVYQFMTEQLTEATLETKWHIHSPLIVWRGTRGTRSSNDCCLIYMLGNNLETLQWFLIVLKVKSTRSTWNRKTALPPTIAPSCCSFQGIMRLFFSGPRLTACPPSTRLFLSSLPTPGSSSAWVLSFVLFACFCF